MLRTTHTFSFEPTSTYIHAGGFKCDHGTTAACTFPRFSLEFLRVGISGTPVYGISTPTQHTHTTRDINDIWFPFCKLHTAALCNCWLRNFGGRLNFLESSIGKISKLEEQSWHFWRFSKFFHPRRKWKNHFDKIRVLNSSPKNEVVIKRSVHYAKVTFLISVFVPRSYSERNLFGFTARHFILLYLA